MRTVNNWPGYSTARTVYPWDKIDAAVEAGEIVVMDEEDYGGRGGPLCAAACSRSNQRRRNHQTGWEISIHDHKVYIRKDQR